MAMSRKLPAFDSDHERESVPEIVLQDYLMLFGFVPEKKADRSLSVPDIPLQ